MHRRIVHWRHLSQASCAQTHSHTAANCKPSGSWTGQRATLAATLACPSAPVVTMCRPWPSTASERTGPWWHSMRTTGVVMLGVHIVTVPLPCPRHSTAFQGFCRITSQGPCSRVGSGAAVQSPRRTALPYHLADAWRRTCTLLHIAVQQTRSTTAAACTPSGAPAWCGAWPRCGRWMCPGSAAHPWRPQSQAGSGGAGTLAALPRSYPACIAKLQARSGRAVAGTGAEQGLLL